MTRYYHIFLFLLFTTGISAQQIIRYTTENGLPSNHVYQIEQDANGFIWFGTNMGVVKFDGKSFRTFTTRDGLPTNDIWRLEATEDGKVWFFSKSKRQGYFLHDSIFLFETNKLAQYPTCFVIKKNEVLFTGNADKHTGVMRLKNGRWIMQDSISRAELVEQFRAKAILLPDGGYIDLHSDTPKLYDKHLQLVYNFKFKDDLSEIIYTKKYGQLGFGRKSYYIYDKATYFTMDPFYISAFNLNDHTHKGIKPFFISEKINTENHYYPELQTWGKYIQISQSNEWILLDEKLTIIERRKLPVKLGTVHIFKDKFGNFWAAGHDYGVHVQPKSILTNNYFFENKKVQTINYENGYLFINIADEGWYAMDPDTKEAHLIIPYEGKVYDMGYHDKLKMYYFYSSGTFWFGKKLDQLLKKEHITVNMTGQGFVKTRTGAKALIETPNGYEGVTISQYIEYDSTFSAINNRNRYNDELPIRNSKAILEFKGIVYIGGDGLYKYDKKSYTEVLGKHPILQASVNTIIPFSEEYILVGTDGFGAYFYDGKEKVITIKQSEGFAINKIVIDAQGAIWMATGNGLHKFTGAKNTLQYTLAESIYDEDGLFENNVNTICFYKNKLFVGQDNGLIELETNPDKYKKAITPYFIPDEFYNKANNTYSITYGSNVSLSFGVMSFPSQKYVRYYYKTSMEDKWIPTKVTTLLMGRQPPGNYTVSFMAVDQHNNSGKIAIQLVILPLWYQTPMAKVGGIILIMLLVMAITLYVRRRAEKKQNAELELNKAMAELELKALRSQMNPHFVFNSLNAIQYLIIKNKLDLSEEYLAKFSRLVRLFFDYSRHDTLTITQETDLLNRYLEIEKLRFEDKLEYSIEVDPEIDPDEMEIPSMILQPILENAVNHGIFHKKGGGQVKLRFTKIDDSSILISAEDDGVGILAMKEMQQDTYGSYRSKSSEVIKERLKILSENKSSKWFVEYTITDIGQVDPKRTGTLVEILLKYKQF